MALNLSESGRYKGKTKIGGNPANPPAQVLMDWLNFRKSVPLSLI